MSVIPQSQIVMWHSMSCVCKRCLENDLLATRGTLLPLTLDLLPINQRAATTDRG